MLYQTIKTFNTFQNGKVNIDTLSELKQHERFWIVERNYWAQNILSKIENLKNDELKSVSNKVFRKIIFDIKTDSAFIQYKPTHYEMNQQYFYYFIYLTNDSLIAFNDNEDYLTKVERIEKVRKKRITEFSYFENKNYSTEDFLQTIADNWYLFKDDENLTIKIIENYLRSDNLRDNRKPFSIIFGNVYANNSIGVLEEIKNDWPDNNSVQSNASSIYQLDLGLGYKIYFNKNTFPLSYVDIQGFYSLGISDAKLKSYGLKLSLPLIYHDVFIVELSSIFSQNKYTFKPFEKEYQKEKFYIIPMIDASIDIYKGVGAEFSFGINYGSINVYYSSSIF